MWFTSSFCSFFMATITFITFNTLCISTVIMWMTLFYFFPFGIPWRWLNNQLTLPGICFEVFYSPFWKCLFPVSLLLAYGVQLAKAMFALLCTWITFSFSSIVVNGHLTCSTDSIIFWNDSSDTVFWVATMVHITTLVVM